MKTTIFSILTLFVCFSTVNAQISIVCPSDVTVNALSLDTNYESYGEPNVITLNSFDLEKVITVVDNNCNGQLITLNYTAVEDPTGSTASCVQEIEVTIATLADIQWPVELVDLQTGTEEDFNPDVMTERPEPYEILKGNTGSSTIIITYSDQVIASGFQQPYKVVRTWTALDWCTSELETFLQVLKIQQLESSAFGVLEVGTYSGSTTIAQEVNVTTDQAGFTLDLSNCTLNNNDLVAYLNCIAENNALNPGSKILVDIVGNEDHLNGVSTLDLVISQRHILGISPFSAEWNALAADVNSDGNVTAFDLLIMRKLILGIIPTFPSSNSWIFIKDSHTPGPGIHPIIDASEGIAFWKSEFPLEALTILAIKIGDVNGSAAN